MALEPKPWGTTQCRIDHIIIACKDCEVAAKHIFTVRKWHTAVQPACTWLIAFLGLASAGNALQPGAAALLLAHCQRAQVPHMRRSMAFRHTQAAGTRAGAPRTGWSPWAAPTSSWQPSLTTRWLRAATGASELHPEE